MQEECFVAIKIIYMQSSITKVVAGSLDLVKIPMDQLHYAVPVSE